LSVARASAAELSYGAIAQRTSLRARWPPMRVSCLWTASERLDPAQRAIMKRLLEGLMKRLTLIRRRASREDLPRA